MRKLSIQTQALYSELLEQLITFETSRSLGHNRGCFTQKIVKGETYYYFQYSELGGKHRQIYLGKKTFELENLEKKFLQGKNFWKTDSQKIQVLSAQLRSGGALATDSASARVLRALAESGFFHSEAVLIGTHAFLCIGNMLGVKWDDFSTRTQDIDLASEPAQIVISDQKIDIPQILERLEMGFLPIPSLNLKHPSTSFHIRGHDVRVDLLTPLRGKPTNKPLFLSQFQAAAQPLRFLDYLIKAPVKSVVLNGESFLVNIPDPSRFAFHKLIVAQERGVTQHSKRDKDLKQAGQILSFLCEERAGDIRLAWKELKKEGKAWEKRVYCSLKQTYKIFPQWKDVLKKIVE